MMHIIKELLHPRNLIAILVTITFVSLAFMGIIEAKLLEYVVISVFGFFFGSAMPQQKQ